MIESDPIRLAQKLSRPVLPKRAYREVGVTADGGHHIVTLDRRPARTPAGASLAVTSGPLAAAIAAEWDAQGTTVDGATMPLTRIVNSAIDSVARVAGDVRAEIVRYAGSDLLCYRAGDPAELAHRQDRAWGPVLDWARDSLGARFILGTGVVPVAQPAVALDRVAAALDPVEPVPLAALSVVTTLTGSALLALAVLRGRLEAAAAWEAAHIDEDWQVERWGRDAEAEARRAKRWRDMAAAATILATTAPGA